MSTPKTSAAYPPPFLAALEKAAEQGEVRIPCQGKISPAGLRLQFYGLCRALRLEGKPEFPEALGFYLDIPGDAVIIRLRDTGFLADIVADALGGKSPEESPLPASASEAQAALRRILGDDTP